MGAYCQVEEYHRPKDVAQTVDILLRFKDSAKLIAGGTDLLAKRPGVKRIDQIKHLVDISHLNLDYQKVEDGHICMGAATNINTIATSPLFAASAYSALSEAANAHSTPTIRNRATIGGNLCTASPCGDLALPLLILDAILVAAGPEGERRIPMEDFFKGANYTALGEGEILLEIRIPLCSENTGTSFLKLRRHQTAIDMAVVNVATSLTREKEHCLTAGIALGCVGPIPFRAKGAESLLTGARINDGVMRKAAVKAAEEARPIDDLRATAAYRKKMVAVWVRRSLEQSQKRYGQ